MKKLQEFNVYLVPFIIFYVYCLLTGTSYAFSVVAYFFVMIPMVLLNVAKLHRRFTENKIVWAIL